MANMLASFHHKDRIREGDELTVEDFRGKVSGQVLRLALISAHYKQPLDWNDKLLEDCQNTIDKWYNAYLPSNKELEDEIIQLKQSNVYSKEQHLLDFLLSIRKSHLKISFK